VGFDDATGGPGRGQAFAATQTGGAWGRAQPIAAALSTGHEAFAGAVSCTSAGGCGAAGSYTDGSGNLQAFVVSQVHGAWGRAQEVAGPLNAGGAAKILSVSCAGASACSAGGYYTDQAGHQQAFVIGRT
jgi:hypothetical protein